MSLKKVICLIAFVAFTALASATEAYACAKDHADIAGVEHAAGVTHDHSLKVSAPLDVDAPAAAPAGDARGRRHTELKGVAARGPKAMLRARAASAALDGGEDEAGECIHGNGCTCRGRNSLRSGCGTAGDCHAHPGLVCTWGGDPILD